MCILPLHLSNALCVLLTSYLLLLSHVTSFDISFQIHSYDDLREWPQVLSKGAVWFKFDFNYQPPTFCQSNATAVERVDKQWSEMGCFILNHDPPVLTRSPGYNTSDDVINFILDHQEKFNDPHKPIHIALCLKYSVSDNLCDGTMAASNATELFTKFFDKATFLIDYHHVNVEFILDGSLTPGKGRECLKDLWKPWNATFTLDTDPAAAYTGNDISTGAERFQINNMDELSFVEAITTKYGKFAHPENDTHGFTKAYPYLLWEPSDQLTLSSNSGAYLSGPRHTIRNTQAPGLRYAINIDLVQFEVYTGGVTGDAWNIPVSFSTDHRNPTVAVWTPRGEPMLSMNVWYDRAEKQFLYQQSQFTHAISAPWSVQDEPQVFQLDPSLTAAIGSGNIGDFQSIRIRPGGMRIGGVIVQAPLFLSDDTGAFVIVDGVNPNSPPIFKSQLPHVHHWSRVSIEWASDDESHDQSLILLQATAASTGDCALEVRGFLMVGTEVSPFPIGTEECILFSTPSGEPLDGESVAISSVVSNDTSLCGPNAQVTESSQAYLLTYSIEGFSYQSYGCVGISEDQLIITSIRPVAIGVGSHPTVSLARQPATGNTIYALLTLTDGYCWNNEYVNKRADIALCDSIPNNQSQILTYGYGRLQSFQSMMDSNGTLSPCSENGILHGSYDQGSSSHSTLFSGPMEPIDGSNVNAWRMQVLEVHVGYVTPSTTASADDSDSRFSTSTGRLNSHTLGGKSTNLLVGSPTSARLRGDVGTRGPSSSSISLSSPSRSSALPRIPPEFCGPAVPHSGIVSDSWKLPYME